METLDVHVEGAQIRTRVTGQGPAIVFVHGGGWRNGDKRTAGFINPTLEFAAKGYVCISVNYRLINSEGDGLPGVMIDVFGDAAVVQITTLGMWQRRENLYSALGEVLKPQAIYQRDSGTYGDVEGFSAKSEVVFGDAGGTLSCREDGLQLEVEPMAGHKTGMFVDQRPARMRVGSLARGRTDCVPSSNPR